jgi:hypothetical protein
MHLYVVNGSVSFRDSNQFSDQTRNAQYPTLNVRQRAFRWRKVGVEESHEAAITVGARQPGGDAICVVLIAVAAFTGEAAAPQRRVDLGDGRAPGRNVPSVEWPEMHMIAQTLVDEAQPRNSGMGRFRYRSLHVEMKNGFRAAGAYLGQPASASLAHARLTISGNPITNEVDIDVVLVGRPVPLEVVEEAGPVGQQPMNLKIT